MSKVDFSFPLLQSSSRFYKYLVVQLSSNPHPDGVHGQQRTPLGPTGVFLPAKQGRQGMPIKSCVQNKSGASDSVKTMEEVRVYLTPWEAGANQTTNIKASGFNIMPQGLILEWWNSRKKDNTTPHLPIIMHFIALRICPPEALCNDSSEKPHYSTAQPICPAITEQLLCSVHEPEDFAWWWHLIMAHSSHKTIRRKSLFFTKASGFRLLKKHIWP